MTDQIEAGPATDASVAALKRSCEPVLRDSVSKWMRFSLDPPPSTDIVDVEWPGESLKVTAVATAEVLDERGSLERYASVEVQAVQRFTREDLTGCIDGLCLQLKSGFMERWPPKESDFICRPKGCHP